MSRIGKAIINVPAKVEIKVDGSTVAVKGPKGQLSFNMPAQISLVQEATTLRVERANEERASRELHGLTRALINNMVTGVSTGFMKRLQIEGVGYRAEMDGKNLKLFVGYSHPVIMEPPENINFVVEDRTKIAIHGIDRQVVGQVAANVRNVRPPEPYLGKGIRYEGEVIRRKAGKAGKGK